MATLTERVSALEDTLARIEGLLTPSASPKVSRSKPRGRKARVAENFIEFLAAKHERNASAGRTCRKHKRDFGPEGYEFHRAWCKAR